MLEEAEAMIVMPGRSGAPEINKIINKKRREKGKSRKGGRRFQPALTKNTFSHNNKASIRKRRRT